MLAWDVTGGVTCVIYWYVQSAQSGIRHPNRLGLGCEESQEKAIKVIDSIYDDSSKASDFITLRYYKMGPYTMQYCHDFFCMSGTISTSQEAKAKIAFFPTSLSNWTSRTRDVTNQEEIDSWILDSDQLQKNHSAKYSILDTNILIFVFAPIGGIIVLVVLILLIYSKIMRKCPPCCKCFNSCCFDHLVPSRRRTI